MGTSVLEQHLGSDRQGRPGRGIDNPGSGLQPWGPVSHPPFPTLVAPGPCGAGREGPCPLPSGEWAPAREGAIGHISVAGSSHATS